MLLITRQSCWSSSNTSGRFCLFMLILVFLLNIRIWLWLIIFQAAGHSCCYLWLIAINIIDSACWPFTLILACLPFVMMALAVGQFCRIAISNHKRVASSAIMNIRRIFISHHKRVASSTIMNIRRIAISNNKRAASSAIMNITYTFQLNVLHSVFCFHSQTLQVLHLTSRDGCTTWYQYLKLTERRRHATMCS